MLLTFNLKFIKSNTAGRHLVWFRSSGWPPGQDVWECCGLAGGTFSIWLSSRVVLMSGGVPNKVDQRKPSYPWLLCPDSQLGDINSACLLLAVTLMRLTHWDLPLLRVGSSAGHGSRGCLMRLMGSCNICHTPGWACSTLSEGGWWLSPHSGPPSHTRGSGSCHWSGKGHPGHVCPPVP